jgi:hypothetical protein
LKEFAAQLKPEIGADLGASLGMSYSRKMTGLLARVALFDGVDQGTAGKQNWTHKDQWVTVRLEEWPDLLTSPPSWPKEASNFRIVAPLPPISLLKGAKPVSEFRWLAQAASGIDHSYVLDGEPAAIKEKLSAELKASWSADGNGFRRWDSREPKVGPDGVKYWPFWSVRVTPIEAHPKKTSVTVGRGEAVSRPQFDGQASPR